MQVFIIHNLQNNIKEFSVAILSYKLKIFKLTLDRIQKSRKNFNYKKIFFIDQIRNLIFIPLSGLTNKFCLTSFFAIFFNFFFFGSSSHGHKIISKIPNQHKTLKGPLPQCAPPVSSGICSQLWLSSATILKKDCGKNLSGLI